MTTTRFVTESKVAERARISLTNQAIRGTGVEQFDSLEPTTKKRPYSLKAAKFNSGGASSNSDDVVFLRLPEVKAITGLSKSSLYALIKEKSFPAPVRLGTRAVAWVRSEVRQWAAERVHASRSFA